MVCMGMSVMRVWALSWAGELENEGADCALAVWAASEGFQTGLDDEVVGCAMRVWIVLWKSELSHEDVGYVMCVCYEDMGCDNDEVIHEGMRWVMGQKGMRCVTELCYSGHLCIVSWESGLWHEGAGYFKRLTHRTQRFEQNHEGLRCVMGEWNGSWCCKLDLELMALS